MTNTEIKSSDYEDESDSKEGNDDHGGLSHNMYNDNSTMSKYSKNCATK